jgi:hypothetical protein
VPTFPAASEVVAMEGLAGIVIVIGKVFVASEIEVAVIVTDTAVEVAAGAV